MAYGAIFQDEQAQSFLKQISENICPLVSESAQIYL